MKTPVEERHQDYANSEFNKLYNELRSTDTVIDFGDQRHSILSLYRRIEDNLERSIQPTIEEKTVVKSPPSTLIVTNNFSSTVILPSEMEAIQKVQQALDSNIVLSREQIEKMLSMQ